MNSQDFCNLQEAYLNVYQEEVLDEAVYGGEPKKPEAPKDDRMVVTNADKKANTKAYQNFKAGVKGYKSADHLGEGVRDLESKKGTAERKARLEKKRGMKLDDHPEYKKEKSVDEATAMAKRGKDETEIRNTIAKKTGASGAGAFADKATSLADRETYGDNKKKEGREKLARTQRGNFRNTTSSSPGLRGYGHKSSDPAVKAKQDARGAQRGRAALTPNERKQLNMEFDFYDLVLSHLLDEGYADTKENALVIMANMSEEWRENILTEVSQDEFRAGMMKAAAKMPSDVRTPSREELFGSKEERSKIKIPKGVVNPTPDTSANIRKSSEYSSPRASRGLPAAGYN